MHDADMIQPEPVGIIERWSRSPLCNMASVFRFSALPVHHRESVAEHTFYVSILALILAQDLIKRELKVNTNVLLQRCIAHDLDESLTGDIIRPFKHSDPELHQRIQTAAEDEIGTQYAQLPGGKSIFKAWREAKSDDIEGRILDFADVWSVYLYFYREARLGNRFAKDKLVLIQERVTSHNWIHPINMYAFELSCEIGRLLEELSCPRLPKIHQPSSS